MHRHGPCTLKGPVTLEYPWWAVSARKSRKRSDTPIREDLVARVRGEIADGTYDTPERWEAALDKLAIAMRLP